jgi:hypothetical protein
MRQVVDKMLFNRMKKFNDGFVVTGPGLLEGRHDDFITDKPGMSGQRLSQLIHGSNFSG